MNAEEKQNLKDVLKYILENVQTIYIIEKYKTKSFRVITLLVLTPSLKSYALIIGLGTCHLNSILKEEAVK